VPILDPRHDLAHKVEPDLPWSESYYFNAYDPDSDAGFFTRIGIRPQEGTADVGMSLWLPGGGIAHYRALREEHGMPHSELVVGDVGYRMLEPMSAWRVTMDGEATAQPTHGSDGGVQLVDVAVDVTFDALTPAIGTDGLSSSSRSTDAATAAARSVGKGHFEQAGGWSGTITIDGHEHQLTKARGNRDKSWGPRRWGGPLMWRWFSINVGDEVHFGGIRIGTDAGDLHRGWVWDGEDASSISEWQVRSKTEDDGTTHRSTELTALDKRGRRHLLHGEIMRVASIPSAGSGERRTLVNEGLTRWSYGNTTGYGIAEYLHQLDASGRPLVAVE
jgi:hypothetical protein